MSAVRLPLPGADLEAIAAASTAVPLSPPATHYLTVVRRLGDGAQITVFDGEGLQAPATLTARGDNWELHLTAPAVAGLASAAVTLCYALPKGDKLDTVIRQSTELGVHRVLVMNSQRSVAKIPADRAAKRRTRWDRIATEAARQSGRADVPAIEGPVSISDAVETTTGGPRWLLDPDGEVDCRWAPAAEPLAVFVGAEGGFDPSERAAILDAGAVSVRTGRRVLRTETAATVACALALHRLGVI